MNNKNIFWIKVKNSSTVSNIFSSTILGQLRKESIYDYGKTNSFVFNKYFDDKKSFWVEAKDHQDIIELIEILSQEFSTPIMALWNKKYIAYNSIGRRIEIESEFEKDYCLVASILEESTGYSFDADKYFEDEEANNNDLDIDEIEDDDEDENDDFDDVEDNEYYCDDSDCNDCNDKYEEESNDDYEFNHEEKNEDDFIFEDFEESKPCGKDCRCSQDFECIDDEEEYQESYIEDDTKDKPCGKDCRCVPYSECDELNDEENACDPIISSNDLNIIDEIKKETMYHNEKVVNLCDEILNSQSKKNDLDSSYSSSKNDIEDSVDIENDEYVCNGSCSKNIDDFGFFFEETNLYDEIKDETKEEEEVSNTLFDVEINIKNNDSFEVDDDSKEEQDFNSKIEEEKRNFDSTFFDLEDKQEKNDEKYDFIVETIENIDNFLNDNSNTEINIEFDLDKEIENESFESLDENIVSSKPFFESSKDDNFFVVEESEIENVKNEQIDSSDKKKSFDVNLEEDEKVLEDFFSIINEDTKLKNNESFEDKTIKNLTLEKEENFYDAENENVLENVFELLEDKTEEIIDNDLSSNIFVNDEVNTKTNEIDVNDFNLNEEFDINESYDLNEKNLENQNLLNELFSNNENNVEENDFNLDELLTKNENTTQDELSENVLEIDNESLYDKNNDFVFDNDYNVALANENIDFDSLETNNDNIVNGFLDSSALDKGDENNFNQDANDKVFVELTDIDLSDNTNVIDAFEQIEKVEDSMYDIYKSNENSYTDHIFANLNLENSENEHIFDDSIIENNSDDSNLDINETIFNVSNELLNDSDEHVVDEDKIKSLYDTVMETSNVEKEVDDLSKSLENDISLSKTETSFDFYKEIHEKNKKVSDELNIFLDELKKEKDIINNREEVILKREKKLKEIMNSDYAKNINIDSSNRKWRVIR